MGALKPPGVLVDDVKRRKILEELGVTAAASKKVVVEEEEKKAQVVPPSLMTEELVKEQAEREKTGALSMIPDKYKTNEKMQSSTSTALSLVNAMANN